jgi:hypothetical protein
MVVENKRIDLDVDVHGMTMDMLMAFIQDRQSPNKKMMIFEPNTCRKKCVTV